MGRMRVEEMLTYAGYDAALSDHLRANHFPPIVGGEEFAELAIDAVVDDDPGRVIEHGDRRGPAGEVVESWHLDMFVQWKMDNPACPVCGSTEPDCEPDCSAVPR